ncbi:MAG: hypothetical protein EA424_09930 [Planctomycetaceae bacterium]|nr:MAG: hypothetical protein EA424_09930 [Planctomycetaceae bacterium]
MILTAGLTPAWQQILLIDGLRIGQVNRANDALWCGSGKVLNAGIAAHHLGGSSLILSTMGGAALRAISEEFQGMSIPFRWVLTKASTRVCTTIVDRQGGTITELVENGRAMASEELDEFCRAFAAEAAGAQVVVLMGSLPTGTPDCYYRRLLEQVACPMVLDFRGAGLLSVLDLQPAAIKPNREELAQTLGRCLDDDCELVDAMHGLNQRGARAVVVTQGHGPVWLTLPGEAYRLHPLPIDQVVNPIGSGDAMAAGIAWAVRAGRSPIDSVRLGMAAAAGNVRQLLPCRLDPHQVNIDARSIRVDRIA